MIKKAQIVSWVFFAAGIALAAGSKHGVALKDTVFVSFDTETTGFSRDKDRLVEIGAVKFMGDGTILATTNWLVNPQRDIPYYATKVHGISDEMVKDAPEFKEIWASFKRFCTDSVLLAHNAPFDIGFLRAALDRDHIRRPPFPVVDTLPLFRNWFPDAKSHSLKKLSTELNVAGNTYHRAEADAFHVIHVMSVGLDSRPNLTLRQLEQQAGGFDWLDERHR